MGTWSHYITTDIVSQRGNHYEKVGNVRRGRVKDTN